jgi:hypothetical protein
MIYLRMLGGRHDIGDARTGTLFAVALAHANRALSAAAAPMMVAAAGPARGQGLRRCLHLAGVAGRRSIIICIMVSIISMRLAIIW